MAAGLAYAILVSLLSLPSLMIALAALFDASAMIEVPALSLGPYIAPPVVAWVALARPYSLLFAPLALAGMLALSMPLFGLARASVQDTFARSRSRDIAPRRTWVHGAGAALAWLGLLLAVGISLGVPVTTVAAAAVRETASFTLLFASALLVYRVLPPITLEIGDVLEASLVASVAIEIMLIVIHAALGSASGAWAPVVVCVAVVLLLPFLAARSLLFGADLAAELSERRNDAAREKRDLDGHLID